MLNFKNADGSPLRSFSSVEEMDETIIERWNAVVKHDDYVYHLGDVIFDTRKTASIFTRLNGKKRLILGNHDAVKGSVLINYFEKVVLWQRFDDLGIIATHLPMHESGLVGKYTRNVHGHIHNQELPSPNHLCVSVERTDFRPVNLSELDSMFRAKGWVGGDESG